MAYYFKDLAVNNQKLVPTVFLAHLTNNVFGFF
jgi:hypothetical protein